MKNLGQLRKEATIAVNHRGHDVNWSAPYHGETQSIQHAYCIRCMRETQVTMNPRPNEIEISGEAVALNCN